MAPPPQKPAEMKQKSLMGYFSKPVAGTNAANGASGTKKPVPNTPAPQTTPVSNATPVLKLTPAPKTQTKPLAPSASLSSVASGAMVGSPMVKPSGLVRPLSRASEVTRGDTPPTSDTVDVEMASSEVDEGRSPTVRTKNFYHQWCGVLTFLLL